MRKSPQSLSDCRAFVKAVNTIFDWPYNMMRGGEYLHVILPGIDGIASGASLTLNGFVTLEVNFNEEKVTFTLLDLAAPQYKQRKGKEK